MEEEMHSLVKYYYAGYYGFVYYTDKAISSMQR